MIDSVSPSIPSSDAPTSVAFTPIHALVSVKVAPTAGVAGFEHGDGELGAVVDHQMRTTRPARSSTSEPSSSNESVVSCAPLNEFTPPPVPTVALTVPVSTVKMNWPVKKPNTSIVAVPANDNSSPSRSIVCVPTVGAVPKAVAHVNAVAVVTMPPAAAPLSSCAPDAEL